MQPQIVGEVTLPDGAHGAAGVPAPGRALSRRRNTRPTRWPIAAASRPTRSGGIAAEIADVAFDQPLVIEQPWTDTLGRRHPTHGRAAGRDARDARHLGAFQRVPHLPRDPSAADAARRDRYAGLLALQVALSEADPARAAAGRARAAPPNTTMPGMALGFPRGPEDLLLDDDGTPIRIDKAFSWDAPIAAHGMMHMRASATPGRAIPTRSTRCSCTWPTWRWNSSMNPGEAARQADRPATRRPANTASRMSSIPTPITPRRSPMPISCCRTRPISSAGIASRCSIARSAAPTGRRTRSASRCCKPDRDVRPFQDVLIDLGARLGLPGFVNEDGAPKYRDYPDYIAQPRAHAGHRPARRLARHRRQQARQGAAEPGPARALRRERLLLAAPSAARAALFQARQPRLPRAGARDGNGRRTRTQIVLQLYASRCSASASPPRATAPSSRPTRIARGIRQVFDPLPFWYSPRRAER